jgi:hypothetical protein
MKYKPRSEDEAEYPQSGMMTEQDIKMAHWSTRQYWEEQDRGQDLKAWDKYWKEKHPEWFPDKDGLPWDEYWDRYWSNANKKEAGK